MARSLTTAALIPHLTSAYVIRTQCGHHVTFMLVRYHFLSHGPLSAFPLQSDHTMEQPLFVLHKHIGAPLFFYLSLLEDHDLIGIHDRTHSMRNDDDGLTRQQT